MNPTGNIMRQVWLSISFTLLVPRNLEKITESKRLDGGDSSVASSSREEVSYLRLLGKSLQVNLLSSLLSLDLSKLISCHTSDDLTLTLGSADMFDTYMNTLLDDPSVDKFVYTDSN